MKILLSKLQIRHYFLECLKFSQSGFSLVEVIVAIGIMSVSSLALITMSTNSSKAIKTLESKSDIIGTVSEIRGILSSPTACTASFGGATAHNSAPLTHIKNELGLNKFSLAKRYGIIKIQSMLMNDSDDEVNVIASSVSDTYLYITFNKGKGTYNEVVTKKIRLWVDVNAAKGIVSCRAFTSGTSNIIERSTADINNVFFDDGNFGIGTNDPTTRLYVDGDTTITGDTYISGNTIINGDVKVGNSGDGCSLGNEGSLRYNSIDKKMEFCNGTIWNKFGEMSIHHGNTATMVLAAGLWKVFIVSNYTHCVDLSATLKLDGNVVQTHLGVGNDSAGCDTISMHSLVDDISGGSHTWSITHSHSPAPATHQTYTWVAYKK